MGKLIRQISLGIAVALLAALLSIDAAAGATTPAPVWAVSVAPAPTSLIPGSPRTEVDRLVVDATGGSFRLVLVERGNRRIATKTLPFNATASAVEAALNSVLENYGPVTVGGGPGATAPYTITWNGGLRELSITPRFIEEFTADDVELSGAGHSARITPVVLGATAPDLVLTATNVGDGATDGSTISIGDVLPSGLTATSIRGYDVYQYNERTGSGTLSCSEPPSASCTFSGSVDSGDSLVVNLRVSVAGGLPQAVPNQVTVSGGGAPGATRETQLPVSETPAPFGPAAGTVMSALSTMQAGAHPDLTTAFTLNTTNPNAPSATPKDVHFDLPVGLVGNTVGIPRCSMKGVLGLTQNPNACPSDAIVGMATISLGGGAEESNPSPVPVYNIAPAPGEPAAFAFNAVIAPVRLDTSVLSDGSYGVRVTAPDLSEAEPPVASSITIWGVPADHNGPGQDQSFYNQVFEVGSFGGPSGSARVPLLSNPTQCSTPLSATLSMDSWVNPGVFVSQDIPFGTLTGCEGLRFSSSFSMLPDTLEAGAPAGYNFDLNVAQNTDPDGAATPDVKNVSVKLPLGTVVNPSAAWGLAACSDAQFGLHSGRAAECPREAQVGTVTIKTPALEEPLVGQVYLGSPECDPCTPADAAGGRMVRLFVNVVGEGESGIVVKLEGHGSIDPGSGQITTSFTDNPQLPFSEFKLTLGGGPRAVLANPRTCGPATTGMDLSPWSAPFTPDSTPSYTFNVSQNCFGPQFNPSFVAGSTNIQAGAHSPFTLSFGRSDQDQFLNGLSLVMPPGLLGNIGAVALCKEPEAAAGTCGAGSLIGHVQVLTGPGADPFLVSGGQVFLTEGYEGAPYGLSIVVPAVAGPYTLAGTTGHGTVVVRARIAVDPSDAHLTVTSDPLPSMLDGIPLQLKVVNVTIDKPRFTFNPTNCAKLTIGASLSSTDGGSANATSPFQVTNCANLGFKPGFAVSTAGRPSRAKGASLTVKLTYPKVAFGSQANIAKVKVDLPKQLPSRLTTLQKACPAAVFNANPANCPAASVVGHATAHTPILPVALGGPAYFVSHGGEAFPSLIVVLQGYGVTVDLVGSTFISKAGITSSTFRQVPDVPIESFELTLPQGKFSALAANLPAKAKGSFCGQTLAMPTAFVAQNGATIHQSTKITPTGCAKAVRHVRKKAHQKKRKK